jgi:hypothetical protein
MKLAQYYPSPCSGMKLAQYPASPCSGPAHHVRLRQRVKYLVSTARPSVLELTRAVAGQTHGHEEDLKRKVDGDGSDGSCDHDDHHACSWTGEGSCTSVLHTMMKLVLDKEIGDDALTNAVLHMFANVSYDHDHSVQMPRREDEVEAHFLQ